MLKDFNEFVRFCFEHGGALRNHKAFGEMAGKLREKIVACSLCNGLGIVRNDDGLGSKNCPACEETEPASAKIEAEVKELVARTMERVNRPRRR